MTDKTPRLIDLETAKRPDVITPETIQVLIEENEHLYIEQVRELGKQYGGELVTKRETYNGLMLNLRNYIKRSGGKLPDVLRPANMPMVEFIPVRLSFRLKMLGIDADRWYFFSRSRIFVLDPGGR